MDLIYHYSQVLRITIFRLTKEDHFTHQFNIINYAKEIGQMFVWHAHVGQSQKHPT